MRTRAASVEGGTGTGKGGRGDVMRGRGRVLQSDGGAGRRPCSAWHAEAWGTAVIAINRTAVTCRISPAWRLLTVEHLVPDDGDDGAALAAAHASGGNGTGTLSAPANRKRGLRAASMHTSPNPIRA